MKEDLKEMKEWTFEEKMKNFFVPSLKWTVERLIDEEVVIYCDYLTLQIMEEHVQHITYDPHLKYILLKDGTVITYLPDKDILVIE